MLSFATTLYNALENPRSRWFVLANDTLAFLTILSIFALSLGTVSSLQVYTSVFLGIEYVAVIFFTAEYIVRFLRRGFRYSVSFFGIVDLLAVLPTFLGFGNLTFLKSARILRVLRFLRMVRLAKLARIAVHPTTHAEERLGVERLNFQIYFFSLTSAVVIFGALIYTTEGYRNEFSNVFLGMIWSAKVILGGVPQYIPETIWGEIVTILARFTGLVLFGLLITVVGGLVKKLLFGTRQQ